MASLEGKVAIITGATGGIGSATARKFARAGARLLLVDREEGRLRELCAELGAGAQFEAGDVSSEGDALRFVQCAVRAFGALHVLFANAGVEGVVAPLTELSVEQFDRVLAVNVRGVFLGIKHAGPEIARAGGGSIIVTSSIAALVGSAGLGAYVTSKHALTGLARTAALELAPQRVRVNTINPGPIDNRMMRRVEQLSRPDAPETVREGFAAKVALGRYGTNEEIANLALFLASSESSYCTGALFVADGGYTAQ